MSISAGTQLGAAILRTAPRVQAPQHLYSLASHDGIVRSTVVCDDEQLISGAMDKTVRTWRLRTATCVNTRTKGVKCVYSVALSPSGDVLVASGNVATIAVWKGASAGGDSAPSQLDGHTGFVYSVAFSMTGILASGSSDTTVRLWDVDRLAPLSVLSGHSKIVRAVAWSPDGSFLASGAMDARLHVWTASRGGNWVRLYPEGLRSHLKAITCVAWAPGATPLMATGCADSSIRVWSTGPLTRDPGEARLLPSRSFAGHESPPTCVAFCSIRHDALYSTGLDGFVIAWDIVAGAPLVRWKPHPSGAPPFHCLAMPSGSVAVSCGKRVEAFEAAG